MIYGTGKYQYRVVENWGRGPAGREPGGVVTAVAVDSQDRVYAFVRKPAVMLVYDRAGRFLHSWGEDSFTLPHAVWISPDDTVYVADSGDHTLRKFTLEGKLLETWGTPGQTGAPGEPFNMPTKAVITPSGEMFVSDGYGQFRVHRFAADGTLLRSWGEQGTGPGQFALPHSLAVDPRGRVLVVDRENNRIQIFDADGQYLTEWPNLLVPMDVYIDRDNTVFVAEARQRISLFTLDGELIDQWGEEGTAPGQFSDSPHWLAFDSHDDLYIAEVASPNRFQKFERVRAS